MGKLERNYKGERDTKFLNKPKRQGKNKEKREEVQEQKRKILFWNIAGLVGRDREFWEYIRKPTSWE